MGRVWVSRGRVEAQFGVHDAARGGERVRPEVGGQESEELGLVGEGGLGDRAGVRQVVGGADGPGVLVRGASGGGAGGGPAVPVFVFERCGPVAGGDDLVADEDPHVVDEDAGALYEFVGGVADRDLHLAARVPAEIDRPVFGLFGMRGVGAGAGGGPPLTGAAGGFTAGGLVVGQPGVHLLQGRATV